MKHQVFTIVVLIGLISCDPSTIEENKPIEISPDDLMEEVIYVRESDVEVKPAFGWDMHTDGQFSYTEGTIIGLEGEETFFLSRERFSSEVGYASANVKVNGEKMCYNPFRDCDYTTFYKNGVWKTEGKVESPGLLEWEFIDLAKTKKLTLKFDQLPKPAKIIEYNEILKLSELNKITFQKESENDSVFFQLAIIPKGNLIPQNPRNSRMVNYALIANNNSFEVSEDNLFSFNISKPTDQDSIFINVVTVKRIVKEINGDLLGFTYYVNDSKPVMIQ